MAEAWKRPSTVPSASRTTKMKTSWRSCHAAPSHARLPRAFAAGALAPRSSGRTCTKTQSFRPAVSPLNAQVHPFLRRCIEIIIENGAGGVGRCPNCRQHIRIAASGNLEAVHGMDECSMCHQVRVIVEERGRAKLCGACVLGTMLPLRYECELCGRFQRIPHPMWR